MPDIGTHSSNTEAVRREPQTVRERLDHRIAHARQEVERLCIAKAKAETLGILDYPQEFIENLAY